MKDTGKCTAARVVADMLGDPGFKHEVEEDLGRRSRIDALVLERVKAGITVADMARKMRVTAKFVRAFEDGMSDLEAEPLAIGLYADALQSLSALQAGADNPEGGNNAGK